MSSLNKLDTCLSRTFATLSSSTPLELTYLLTSLGNRKKAKSVCVLFLVQFGATQKFGIIVCVLPTVTLSESLFVDFIIPNTYQMSILNKHSKLSYTALCGLEDSTRGVRPRPTMHCSRGRGCLG